MAEFTPPPSWSDPPEPGDVYTPEQLATIPAHVARVRHELLRTDPLSTREKAEINVDAQLVYISLGLVEPRVLFARSPEEARVKLRAIAVILDSPEDHRNDELVLRDLLNGHGIICSEAGYHEVFRVAAFLRQHGLSKLDLDVSAQFWGLVHRMYDHPDIHVTEGHADLEPPPVVSQTFDALMPFETIDRALNGTATTSGFHDLLAWLADFGWVAELSSAPLPAEVTERCRRLHSLARTGFGIARLGLVIICDRPSEIHLDSRGEFHSETGPAIAWSDETRVNAWHGLVVPPDFHSWDIRRALEEPNQERRRSAFERIGWDKVLPELELLATAEDPGNPGQLLQVYAVPPSPFSVTRQHLLLVSNASVDKGGHRRRFALMLDPLASTSKDPVAAAASLFGVSRETYASMERAT